MTLLRNEKLEFAKLAVINCNSSQVTGSYAAIAVGQLVIIRVGNRPGPVVQRGRATGRSRLDAVRRPVKALRLLRFRLRKKSCPEHRSGLIFNWSMVQAHHGLTPKPPK